MKKLYVLVLLFTGIYSGICGQSQTTTVEYKKINRDAVSRELPFPEKTVINAIEDTLEKMGYHGKESKGFMVFKGVALSAFGTESYDLYISTDRKSKREKESSVVTMMVSKGEDNFITEAADPGTIKSIKNYLDNISPSIAHYDLEQQIAAQEDIVRKAERKSANLSEDADDLQKKKKKIEEQIADNIKDQAKQKDELTKESQLLEALKAKRVQ